MSDFEFLTGRKGRALRKSMPERIGYVVWVFTDKSGGLSSEAEVIREKENPRGWQNKLNFGRGAKIEKLFDRVCPIVLNAIRYPAGSGWKLKPSVRRIDFDVLKELMNEIELEFEDLRELSFDEKLKWCRKKWVLAQVVELKKLYEQQSKTQWEFHPSTNSASSRLYHPLLSVPREVRSSVLVRLGYRYQMDIKSAHPVLLHQAFERVMKGVSGAALPKLAEVRQATSRPLLALPKLASDPDAFRRSVAAAVAAAAGIDDLTDVLPVVKLALSALLYDTDALPVFDGASSWLIQADRSGSRAVVACWRDLGVAPGACYSAYQAFRSCVLVRELWSDYRYMRRLITPLLHHRMTTSEGRIQVAEWLGVEDIEILPHIFQSKNPIYFLAELMEKRIRDVLAKLESNVFLVHDAVVFKKSKIPSWVDTKIHEETDLSVKLTGEYLIDYSKK
jgi:hypothetical protein